ncbi:DUF6366 family protein [Rossellomorea arthrocnemi]|uniref:DUF6366 family protein n=1 Tax=Rossellomorea arthrocnemi TaxID=2769542 RepID=UPI001917FC2B|nr:DUF6366 family protein [Rossellomorea arthrocnemi]
MENNKGNPEHKREKLSQEEFKKNPMGDMNNHSNLAEHIIRKGAIAKQSVVSF